MKRVRPAAAEQALRRAERAAREAGIASLAAESERAREATRGARRSPLRAGKERSLGLTELEQGARTDSSWSTLAGARCGFPRASASLVTRRICVRIMLGPDAARAECIAWRDATSAGARLDSTAAGDGRRYQRGDALGEAALAPASVDHELVRPRAPCSSSVRPSSALFPHAAGERRALESLPSALDLGRPNWRCRLARRPFGSPQGLLGRRGPHALHRHVAAITRDATKRSGACASGEFVGAALGRFDLAEQHQPARLHSRPSAAFATVAAPR